MDSNKEKLIKRKRKHARIRAKISGTSNRPRLSVFVSNRSISAQLIDDDKGATIASVTSKGMKEDSFVARAFKVGKEIAQKAKEKKLEKVVFDRGGFLYSGKVKALAEGAREGGLIF